MSLRAALGIEITLKGKKKKKDRISLKKYLLHQQFFICWEFYFRPDFVRCQKWTRKVNTGLKRPTTCHPKGEEVNENPDKVAIKRERDKPRV